MVAALSPIVWHEELDGVRGVLLPKLGENDLEKLLAGGPHDVVRRRRSVCARVSHSQRQLKQWLAPLSLSAQGAEETKPGFCLRMRQREFRMSPKDLPPNCVSHGASSGRHRARRERQAEAAMVR